MSGLFCGVVSRSMAARVMLNTEHVSNESSSWPWQWGSGQKCADVVGSWAQAGVVWRAGSEGVPHSVDNGHMAHCSGSGFAVRTHGDGNNRVEFMQDGRFLYVSGLEVGTGAGATICDLDEKPSSLEYVYTDGLMGCMGLSITGTRVADGKRDMFFTHSRRWSDYKDNPAVPENDPLRAAQDFIRTHININVFYGSGDHAIGPGWPDVDEEAMYLSNILGVHVMRDSYHCFAVSKCVGL